MKQITAVIQPHMLTKVQHALHALPHCPGFTLLSAKGHSRGRAPGHAYHPTEQDMDLRVRQALLIICSDTHAPSIVDAIRRVESGQGVVVLTDMFGGTPSNLAISAMDEANVEVIAGINLPILVKLASIRGETPLGEAVARARDAGRKYIKVASQELSGES